MRLKNPKVQIIDPLDNILFEAFHQQNYPILLILETSERRYNLETQ